jgi:hypothetical protein
MKVPAIGLKTNLTALTASCKVGKQLEAAVPLMNISLKLFGPKTLVLFTKTLKLHIIILRLEHSAFL